MMERQVQKKFSHIFKCILICGLTLVIQCRAQGSVVTENETAMLEKPASLQCSLHTPQEIMIVTWQKLTDGTPEIMAAFSKQHGVVIQSTYKNKIEMTQPGLSKSTLTFLRPTVEDEGCYLCIFNIFGAETVSGKTCLNLYVRPTVFLTYQFSEGHLNVICSATARPPPEISWKVGLDLQISSERVIHPNGTTSVSSILHIKDSDKHVGKEIFCVVQHMGTSEKHMVIPTKDDAAFDFWVPIFVGILIPVMILPALIFVFFYWKCWLQKRDLVSTFHPEDFVAACN